MAATAERARLLSLREQKSVQTYHDIVAHIPDAIREAQKEAEITEITHSPEGKFALTYLLAAQSLLTPALNDMTIVNADLLEPTGGPEYNPHRSIDAIGTTIAHRLSEQTTDIPKFWIHSEESAQWEPTRPSIDRSQRGERFAVIDPLDMTHAITKGDRIQTTGIAIFNKNGDMIAAGLASLVDDGIILVEHTDHDHIYTNVNNATPAYSQEHTQALRVATLTRRMYDLRNLPLFTQEGAANWTLDCASGFAVLELLRGNVDTIVDPIKGNPWYEVAIWSSIAQKLGMQVTDWDNTPLDIPSMMHRVIERHEDDNYRIPFVISRTPEIHKKVIGLLHEDKNV